MDKAILLTGFNNWGKTTHIYRLFNRGRFYAGATYSIVAVNAQFTVESHSNDDVGEDGFVQGINGRIDPSPDNGRFLFCAFCPTREGHNDSHRILTHPPFSQYRELHVIYLKHKWDHHAELCIQQIQAYFADIPNLHQFTVDEGVNQATDLQRTAAREAQIIRYLQGLFL